MRMAVLLRRSIARAHRPTPSLRERKRCRRSGHPGFGLTTKTRRPCGAPAALARSSFTPVPGASTLSERETRRKDACPVDTQTRPARNAEAGGAARPPPAARPGPTVPCRPADHPATLPPPEESPVPGFYRAPSISRIAHISNGTQLWLCAVSDGPRFFARLHIPAVRLM